MTYNQSNRTGPAPSTSSVTSAVHVAGHLRIGSVLAAFPVLLNIPRGMWGSNSLFETEGAIFNHASLGRSSAGWCGVAAGSVAVSVCNPYRASLRADIAYVAAQVNGDEHMVMVMKVVIETDTKVVQTYHTQVTTVATVATLVFCVFICTSSQVAAHVADSNHGTNTFPRSPSPITAPLPLAFALPESASLGSCTLVEGRFPAWATESAQNASCVAHALGTLQSTGTGLAGLSLAYPSVMVENLCSCKRGIGKCGGGERVGEGEWRCRAGGQQLRLCLVPTA